MTQKESLLNLLRTVKATEITLYIKNPEMKMYEKITFSAPDFNYKADYIERTYDEDLRLVHNKTIQIVGINIINNHYVEMTEDVER